MKLTSTISLFLILASPVGAADDVCTVAEGTFGGQSKIFAPVEIDCPPVGERTVVSFSWKLPEDEDGGAAVQRTIAGTHGKFRNLTNGIALGPQYYNGDCNDWRIPVIPDNIIFTAEYSEICAPGLSEKSLCQGVSVNDASGTIKNDGIVVFNTGSCEDKIKLEVSLSGIFGGPGDCLTPLVEACRGLAPESNGAGIGSGTTEGPTGTPAGIQATSPTRDQTGAPTGAPASDSDVCEGLGEDAFGNKDKVFAPLEIDCPPEGERVVVHFSWQLPEDEDEYVAVQRTVAITHGEFHNLTEGIVVGLEDFNGDCDDWLLANKPDDIFISADYVDYCATGLSPKSLCQGVSVNDASGAIKNDGIVVFNTGGCEDKIRLEVSLSGIFGGPGECITPLVKACQGSTPLYGNAESNPFATPTGSLQCTDVDVGLCLVSALFDEDVDLYDSCGPFGKKISKNWCYDPDSEHDVCCGPDLGGYCCEANPGPIAGVLVAVILLIVASIFGCCYCCSCCCMYDRMRGNNNVNEASGAPAPQETAPATQESK